MTRYYFYFINILFCISLQAQVPEDLFFNESSIQKLQNGSLLVRLESKEKKIQFLKSDLQATDCNKKCKIRIEAQIEDIIHSRDTFNLQFINSFKNYFRFCPVYFYYDKDQQDLVNAQYNGAYFLDENLRPLLINSVKKDSILILKKDLTPNSQNEGWLFQTIEGVTLKNGFPFISENNYKTLLNRIVSSDHLKLNCDYMIKKLNKELYAYQMNNKK